MRRAALLSLFLLLAACGFHRQGVIPLPASMQTTYIDTKDERSVFMLQLTRALEDQGAKLSTTREAASAELVITRDDTGRRVLSVSATNTPTEYEIYYIVTWSVRSGGREVLEPQTLHVTRDYSFNEEALLAKEQEEDILRQALARDLVGIVMRRLATL